MTPPPANARQPIPAPAAGEARLPAAWPLAAWPLAAWDAWRAARTERLVALLWRPLQRLGEANKAGLLVEVGACGGDLAIAMSARLAWRDLLAVEPDAALLARAAARRATDPALHRLDFVRADPFAATASRAAPSPAGDASAPPGLSDTPDDPHGSHASVAPDASIASDTRDASPAPPRPRLPLYDATASGLVALGAVARAAAPAAFLAECARVLRPGGALLLGEPVGGWWARVPASLRTDGAALRALAAAMAAAPATWAAPTLEHRGGFLLLLAHRAAPPAP